ncbi:hypothetical protein [Phage f2b1]|nr:hypothetical protein [Phage f2b1]
MTIQKSENGNVQINLGSGDVLTGQFFEDGKGVLTLLNAPKGEEGAVGVYRFLPHLTEGRAVKDYEVAITFDNVESIDVIIGKLRILRHGLKFKETEGK